MRRLNTVLVVCALNVGCTAIVSFDDYRFDTDTHVDSDGAVGEVDAHTEVDASVEVDTGIGVDSSVGVDATTEVDASRGVDASNGTDAAVEVDASTYVEPNGPLQYQCQPCANGTGCGTGTCSSQGPVVGYCRIACMSFGVVCTNKNSLRCTTNAGCLPAISVTCDEWLLAQWGPKP